jgi:WXG100 family type VII secretion target
MTQPTVISADGTETTVTPDVILQAANDSTTTATEIEAEIELIKMHVRAFEGRYVGLAAVEVEELMMQFTKQTDLVKQKLEEISNGLWTVYHNYTGTETQNLQNAARMSANIPNFSL